MKLYMHPVSITSRPVRLLIAEKGLDVEEEVVDLMTGAHHQEQRPNQLGKESGALHGVLSLRRYDPDQVQRVRGSAASSERTASCPPVA